MLKACLRHDRCAAACGLVPRGKYCVVLVSQEDCFADWIKTNYIQYMELTDSDRILFRALKARMKLEEFSYEYLDACEPFLTPEDKTGWQPRHVFRFLVNEIDRHLAEPKKISISSSAPDKSNPTKEDYEKLTFFGLGETTGVDIRKLANLWHKLGSVLHAKMENEEVRRASLDVEKTISEATDFLEMSSRPAFVNGAIKPVSISCANGHKHERNIARVKKGQILSCIKPDCSSSFLVVEQSNGKLGFQEITLELKCDACGKVHTYPPIKFTKMSYWETGTFVCDVCNHSHTLQWVLGKKLPQLTDPGNS